MDIKKNSISLKVILISIGVGIWVLVLQNAGIIPTKQNVYVKGGYIDAAVKGSVDVDNTVDINISRINGSNKVFYQDKDGEYMVLPVTVR